LNSSKALANLVNIKKGGDEALPKP